MISIVKIHAPFERLRACNTDPEVSLYKSIILQAIIDACNSGEDKKSRYIKATARSWLLGKSEAFIDVCICANLKPEFVTKIAKLEMSMHKKASTLRENKKKLDKIILESIIDSYTKNPSNHHSSY